MDNRIDVRRARATFDLANARNTERIRSSRGEDLATIPYLYPLLKLTTVINTGPRGDISETIARSDVQNEGKHLRYVETRANGCVNIYRAELGK